MSLCREQSPCKDASPLVPVHSTPLHAGAGRPPVVQRVGHPWGTGAGWVAYRPAPAAARPRVTCRPVSPGAGTPRCEARKYERQAAAAYGFFILLASHVAISAPGVPTGHQSAVIG